MTMLAGGVDHLGAIGLDVRADGHDAVAFDQDVAGSEIGNLGIHRDDGAALEEGACGVGHAAVLHSID